MRGINREMSPFGKYGDLLGRPNGRPVGTQEIPQRSPRSAGRGTMQMGGGDPEAIRRAKEALMAQRPPSLTPGEVGGIRTPPQIQPRMPQPGIPPGLSGELPVGGMQPPMIGREGMLPPQFGGGFQQPLQPMQPPQAVPGGGGLGLGGMPRMMGMQPQVQEMMRRRGFGGGGYGRQFGGMV